MRRDHPALQPGEPLPLAALDQEILLQHRQADHRRTRVAIRTQCQVDAEDETVVGRVPDQRVQALGDATEVFVRADAGSGAALRDPGGLAIVFVDIDQVDVGRHVQLACAELAHADDPEIDQLALRIQRRSAARIFIGTGRSQRDFQRDLGQQRHRSSDLLQCRGLLHIEHGQALEHELAQHPQGRGQRPALRLKLLGQVSQRGRSGQSGQQQRQLGGIAPAHALDEAAVVGAGAGWVWLRQV